MKKLILFITILFSSFLLAIITYFKPVDNTDTNQPPINTNQNDNDMVEVAYPQDNDKLIVDSNTEPEDTHHHITEPSINKFNKESVKDVFNKESNINSSINQILKCKECKEELLSILQSNLYEGDAYEKVVLSLAKINDKDSAELLLQATITNTELGYKDNLEVLQKSLSNLTSLEAVDVFANYIFSDENIKTNLSYSTEYSMIKTLKKTSDRQHLASTLNSLYENSTNEMTRSRITKLDYPELFAIQAITAYSKGDDNEFNKMVDNLTHSNNENAVEGFITLSRKMKNDSFDNIVKSAEKWSGLKKSSMNKNIIEDYLTDYNRSPEERIMAAALLSKNPDHNAIFKKVLQQEKDINIKHYLNKQLN